MPDYPSGVTPSRLSGKPLLRAQCAARDGGWFCFYCKTPLADPDNPEHWDERTYPCSISHPSGEVCEAGCEPVTGTTAKWGLEPAHLDHVLPQSRGGSHKLPNRVLSCPKCNNRKGARTPGEWLGAVA